MNADKTMVVQQHSCYALLKRNEGKVFRLEFSDGEIAIARVTHVDDEYQDFVYEVISSTVPKRYKDKKRDSYAGKFADLRSAKLEEGPR